MSSSNTHDKRRRWINITSGFLICMAGIGLQNALVADGAMRRTLADKCNIPRALSDNWSSEELEAAGRFCQLGFNDLLTSSPLYLISLVAVLAVAFGHTQISRKLGIGTIGDLLMLRDSRLQSSNPELHQQLSKVGRWGFKAMKVQLVVLIGGLAAMATLALAVTQPVSLILIVPVAYLVIRYFRSTQSSK
jgi:hypothetical protein